MRDYKRKLLEGAEPHLAGEDARVLALAQRGMPPWLQFIPYGLIGLGFSGGIGGDSYLPGWATVLMLVLGAAGAFAVPALIPRRMLVRTDQHLYVFKQPNSAKASVEPPLSVHDFSTLIPAVGGKRPELDGDRYYPSFGASGEKDAIAIALSPESP